MNIKDIMVLPFGPPAVDLKLKKLILWPPFCLQSLTQSEENKSAYDVRHVCVILA